MSPTLNGSSALQRFEHGNAVEVRNRIMFNFYLGLPQMFVACNIMQLHTYMYIDTCKHVHTHMLTHAYPCKVQCPSINCYETYQQNTIPKSITSSLGVIIIFFFSFP